MPAACSSSTGRLMEASRSRATPYPTSSEVSDLDGKLYKVQYFERAVMEYHPENQPPYNVLLSQLGTFRLRALTAASNSAGNGTQVVAGQLPIKHIVIFIKENRTFDNYFGTYPGANGATTAMDTAGDIVPLRHQADQITDIDHSSQGAILAFDGGKMDKFNLLGAGVITHPVGIYENGSLSQFYQGDIPNYWRYAQNFVLGDAMFSSMMAPASPTIYTRWQGKTGA